MTIDIVFEGAPGPVAPTFVEVENEEGASIRVGTWVERPDGYWALRITPATMQYSAQERAVLRTALKRYIRAGINDPVFAGVEGVQLANGLLDRLGDV